MIKYNRYMDYKKVLSIFEAEKECISKKELQVCKGECDKCSIKHDPFELIDAYNLAIVLIKEGLNEL